jgi:hypothetical protein
MIKDCTSLLSAAIFMANSQLSGARILDLSSGLKFNTGKWSRDIGEDVGE